MSDNKVQNEETMSQEVFFEQDDSGCEAEQEETTACEKTDETEEKPKSAKRYHERYYLRYDGGKRSRTMDLAGTNSFLKGIGFDGGELRQARMGKDYAQIIGGLEKAETNRMYCSYCGSEITGVEFYRIPDGRIRCTYCSGSVVETKEEVEAIRDRVLENLDTFFGATIDVPVSIEVLGEHNLKRKIGMPLGDRDGKSPLVLGVAVNKKNDYRILLENGAPRISLIATFAHELTHIWQYMNWDNKPGFRKCPADKRLLIYEGMAKWAEIQYLYFIGETSVARREEALTRSRQDEYGIGFCIYESYYPLSREAMKCDTTPFTPNKYPFD